MNELVYIKNGKALTTSQEVAKAFSKNHRDILKSIRELNCSQEFRERNFSQSSYINSQNKKQPMYELTKDGFVILVMGFTGKKAMEWKEKYISLFNEMERCLIELKETSINNYVVTQAKSKIERYSRQIASELSQLSLFPIDVRFNVKVYFNKERKKIIIYLDYKTHQKYKVYCAKNNLSMRGAIKHFIDECIKELK